MAEPKNFVSIIRSRIGEYRSKWKQIYPVRTEEEKYVCYDVLKDSNLKESNENEDEEKPLEKREVHVITHEDIQIHNGYPFVVHQEAVIQTGTIVRKIAKRNNDRLKTEEGDISSRPMESCEWVIYEARALPPSEIYTSEAVIDLSDEEISEEETRED